MYLKQTNAVASLKNVEDAHIRPQLSYFIHNEDSPWLKYSEKGAHIRLEKGKILQYDTQYVYYLKSGLIRFSRKANESILPLFYLGSGTLCFEMHVIGHSATPHSCFAIDDCSLIRFPTLIMRQLVFENPFLSFQIMESIGSKYSVLLTRLNEMGSHNLVRNVARLVLDMASFYKFNHILTPPICQRELAEFFCVHRSSINRTIAQLREKKIIADYTKNRLEILNLPGLIDLASVTYL